MTRGEPAPAVDVIIPVRNGARFVTEAIASVVAQEFAGNLTVWCIDDASSDDSLTTLMASAAADPRVRVLRNPRNLGVAATRNLAVRAGTSEYIAFLDQDDLWLPGKLALQFAALEEQPQLGFITGLQVITLVDGESRPAWTRADWFEHPQPGNLPSALLVRRDVFLDVGFLDETMTHGGDDVDWFARARRLGVPHRMLEVPVVTRRIHTDNTSGDHATDGELLAVVRRHLTAPGDPR